MDDPEPKREGGRAARRASDTHQRLLQAALSIFNEMGFDGCAIEDITEKADVGKGTFYRHFHDKHAILVALIDRVLNDLGPRITRSQPSVTTIENCISAVVSAHMSMYRERQDLFMLFLQAHGMMAARKESLPELQPAFARYWSLLEAHLAVTPAPGVTPTTPKALASAVSGSIFGMIMAGLSAMPREAVEARLDAMSNVIVAGIAQHLR